MQGEWIQRPKSDAAIIFVHGVLSSAESCWRNANGCFWPQLLANEAALGAVGIYSYTYSTGVFSGNYRLSDVVDDLKERIRLDGVIECKKLLFVCHSMGGIVVRKLLVERAIEFSERKSKIGLFLLASPSLGSSYADMLAGLVRGLGNAQGDALRFVRNNPWLNDLDKEFINLKESKRIEVTGKELIEDKFLVLRRFWKRQVVEPFSGARYFGEPYKVPNSDHFSIAKPADVGAIQHRLLCRFIGEMGITELVDSTVREPPKVDRLAALVAQHSILAAAQSEIESTGISIALADSILSSEISPIDLADFYLIMAQRVSGQKLYGVACCALELIDKFDVGYSVIEYCVEQDRLEPDWRGWIVVHIVAHIASEPAVLWCHKQLTTKLRYEDVHYHSFLLKHISKLAEKDLQTIIAYLLHPDRGPGSCNMDSFYLAITNLKDSTPFVRRWKEWIIDGRFDGNENKGNEGATVLYRYLNRAVKAQDARFAPRCRRGVGRN